MSSFRDFLEALREKDELLEVVRPTDLRDVAALVPQADKALLFRNVKGYSTPVASGLLQSRARIAIALGTPYEKIAARLRAAMDHPLAPAVGKDAPVKEVIATGAEVDLYDLPVPIFSILDGGPMITGAVVIADDPEYGMNAGMYRLMLKQKNLTGIDIVTPNNLRRYAERALEAKRALPISIAIGAHPCEMIASTFKAALGTNELAFAGGLRGAPVRLAAGETIPVPCIADAEFVLEGEILPEGWIHPEGPFGEFNRLMGGIHYNPHVKIKAILHRRNPVYYALHMPWENIWMSAPIYEAAAWRALSEAGVTATAIHVTPGGCCHWHIIAAIKKQPGDGKNAILALLSIADIKHVIVTDDDIDIFDPVDVEWAVATRVQADRDVVIVANARSKPLDPSLPPTSGIPTTAKMGIDATIPENVPRERYRRIVYFNEGKVRLKDFLGGERAASAETVRPAPDAAILARQIAERLASGPRFFAELLELFPDSDFASVARALGALHESGKIAQDESGKYRLTETG
ncbi:MAG TPA: UbiD family decarboxylase [Candidatus Acidoferrales bacterium]|nr:UbiD family decarboxylase [Candidatus Acidoferrales bacterium]